jgi:hypothetical protein
LQAAGYDFGKTKSCISTPAALKDWRKCAQSSSVSGQTGPEGEASAMATYIAEPSRAAALNCVDAAGVAMITRPSVADPAAAAFDTSHGRPALTPSDPITLLHIFLPC